MADRIGGNPYRWDVHRPVVVTEPRLWSTQAPYETDHGPGPLVERLMAGQGVVVYGGRGMGKSVLVERIVDRLRALPGVNVARIVGAEAGQTAAEVLSKIGRALDIREPVTEARTLVESVDVRQAHVVVLIDEVDVLVRYDEGGVSVARAVLDQLDAVRRDVGRLGVLAAGGLALTRLSGPLGSAFVSRASDFFLVPLSPDRIREVAAPFAERGLAFDDAMIDAIGSLSAGVPALVTYALEKLWPLTEPSPDAVAEILGWFPRGQTAFMAQLADNALGESSEPPGNALAVLRAIREAPSYPIPLADLHAALTQISPSLGRVLPTLRAAGFIRWDGVDDEALVDARPSGSPILDQVPRAGPSATAPQTLAERLDTDLRYALSLIYQASPDFRRQKGEVVPEATFRAFLSAVLTLRRWSPVPEVQQAAGRVDIRAEHPRHPGEHAVVEVKIWPRNDSSNVHAQAASYRLPTTTAAAVVMIGHRPSDRGGWGALYATECLDGLAFEPSPIPDPAPLTWVDAPAPPGPGCDVIRHYLSLLAQR